MRTSSQTFNKTLKKQVCESFFQLIADIKSKEDSETFIKDFFTESEVELLSKRLAIAYWLKKGRSYKNIKDNLKVSSATIASVQSMMEKPGMKLALKNIEAEEWANQWSERIKKYLK